MPSTRKLKTKDGRVFYEISVSRGRGKSRLTRRWYPPDGWSRKAIERELSAVAAEFERQSDAGEIISRSEQREREAQAATEAAKILTLRQYGERVFMPSKAVTMSENSRSNYQSYLDKKIYPALGDLKLPEITPAQITALLLDIQAEGKAHSTVIKVYTILHSFFKMAYLGDMIDRNPMDKVERPKPRKSEATAEGPQAYTPAEVQRLFQALEAEPLKWRAMVHLLIDTGIRRGRVLRPPLARRGLRQRLDHGIRESLLYRGKRGISGYAEKRPHQDCLRRRRHSGSAAAAPRPAGPEGHQCLYLHPGDRP